MRCPNCQRMMQRRVYSLSPKPDALRKRDGRAPLERAWHCRCGKWVYDPRVSTPRLPAPRSANHGTPKRFTLLDWPK